MWSREDLGKPPPSHRVLETLLLIPDAGMKYDSARELDDPNVVVGSSLYGDLIGEWNASDDCAAWACKPGSWIIIAADLARDDETPTSVTFAVWRVTDGYAVLVTDPAHDHARVPAVMGMPWPSKWKNAKVWYGE